MATGEDVASEGDGIGEVVEVFHPGMDNVVAGFILSALLLCGGAAAVGLPVRAAYLAGWNLPMNAKPGWSWSAVGLFCAIGVALLGAGVALAVYARWLAGHRVDMCANGLRQVTPRSVSEVRWADVAAIRETVLYERLPLLKGPAKLLLPKIASRSYMVVTVAGAEHGFDGDSVRHLKRFGVALRAGADGAGVAWQTVEEHA